MTPEELLETTLARIRPPDESVRAAAARGFDAKTKPRGGLGRLETLAARIAAIRREPDPDPLGTLAALGGFGLALLREMATFGDAGVTDTGA